MSLVAIGASHHSAPLALLEKMAVDADRLDDLLARLLKQDHVSEAVVISTCNRTEIYAVAEKFHGAYKDVRDLFSDLTFLPPESFVDHLTVQWDTEAVRHLFEVASGLDSAVLGEHEILGQVRESWEAARLHGATGPALNLLFRRALETGKRARTETAISRSITSVSQAAVVMAAERIGGLGGATAVVVGAGTMGRGMVSLLADAGAREVIVVNRSLERAARLLEGRPGRATDLGSLADELAQADVVFTSTAASIPVLTEEMVRRAMAGRDGRPLSIVDIAMPRDVEEAVGHLDGVDLLDMDDLRRFAETGIAERRGEVPKVRQIIDEEVERYEVARTSRAAAPLISEVHRWAESVRAAEADRFAGRLDDLTPAQREAVEALTRGIVAKLLHHPTVRLKDATGTLRGERLGAALRDLFDLG